MRRLAPTSRDKRPSNSNPFAPLHLAQATSHRLVEYDDVASYGLLEEDECESSEEEEILVVVSTDRDYS